MGRMLKLMGNASPARQEAFLTLMERGMRRGRVGGWCKVHWFPNSCRASVAFPATLKLLSPLLSPLFLPLHCPPAPLSSFRLSFVRPPLNTLTYWPLTPPPGLSMLLCYHPLPPLSLFSSPKKMPFFLPCLTSFPFHSVCRNITKKIIFHASSYVCLCHGASLPHISWFYCMQ